MVNGTLSTERPVLSGVPQGSVLGPTLFLLYINCIGTEFKSNHLLFADDLKLYSLYNTLIDTDLRILEKWCYTWKMKVAPKKCEHIIFSHKNKSACVNYINLKLNDMPIPAVSTVRDLGIHFSSQLSFTHHHTLTIRKAHQRINILFSVLKYSSWKIFIKCFVVYISPLLEYGTVVTSPILKENVIMLESVQKSFIFRVYKNFNMTYTSYLRRLTNELDKLSSQILSNRVLRCWNSLSDLVFPVKPSTAAFKSRISKYNLNHFLSLNPTNY
ncbi:hypothetical protein CRE_26190 [Caenorhabditis remanei]|uniref:Reverse transcriptase domain-containing protein n=1 Tax=Caenorhabditis remanei TaxID=31234 RepID=E3LQN7_CAERE|nr:hypothetical protein CRE_26190 [Caenorhabditis remanei]